MLIQTGVLEGLKNLAKLAAAAMVAAATVLTASLLSAPVWAPEDPWRVVTQSPPVATPREVTRDLLADLLKANRMRMAPEQRRVITQAVARESQKYGIDPRLLLSLIMTESTFRTDAVSHKGAVGLMQLMPSTARGIAHEMDLDWSGDHLLQPETNIALGAYYLRQLLERFEDLDLALTAYNMGPTYVQNRLTTGELVPSELGFRSTYAQKVFTRMGDLPSATHGSAGI